MASALAIARDLDPRARLPYARHVSPSIIALDTGALMTAFRLEGASFETADIRDLNDWHAKLNGAWRNLASDRLAVWHHLVRRVDKRFPEGRYRSAFASELDAAYRARIGREQLFVNELYVTLILHPGLGAGEKIQSGAEGLLGRFRPKARASESNADRIRHLSDACRDLAQHLARYQPRELSLIEDSGLQTSEPMRLLHLLLTGEDRPQPLVCGHLGSAIYDARLIFGRETIEIRGATETRYAGVLGVKEYPAQTRPGLWDELLSARFPLLVSQSFAFLSKSAARAVVERKQNQMTSARDRAASQIAGLDDALDDLTSNRFVMGDHQASFLVYGETPKALQDHLSKARAILADSGLVVAREDLALEAAFWSQFPGNFALRPRPAAINSRNFAALAPFHTHPAGRSDANHWGPSVTLLRTSAGSPFHFNFHVGDLGHTFICGPSGSGKTVVQNFLLAALEKLGPQQVFFDKDRGAEIFVRASGGIYLDLKTGQPTGLAPFKALAITPENRVFLAALVRQLVSSPERGLTSPEIRAIEAAIGALEPLPMERRSLGALRSLLGQRDAAGIGARLDRWVQGGPLGWVFDNDTDALSFGSKLMGFDMTDFLDHPEVRTPIMMYLFQRLSALVDGRRLVIDIDEFWKALGDPAFRDLAQDGLKTYRKQNAFMVFGTQSPADVLRSDIAHTILEQCATKIFFPNPHAQARDYMDGFGLTEREFRLVREDLIPERRQFLVKQGLNSVVVELDLSGLGEELAILSGRSETVALLDRLRAVHGDDYAQWRSPFHQARRGLS